MRSSFQRYRRTMMSKTMKLVGLGSLLLLGLSGCASSQSGPGPGEAPARAGSDDKPRLIAAATASQPATDTGAPREKAVIQAGSGQFINARAASKPAPAAPASGDVTLNFELADIRDVIKVVFDTLGQNYVVDPQIQGVVTVQTSQPLPKDALIPTLETLLRANNAALVKEAGMYKIIPAANALSSGVAPRLRSAQQGQPGYGVRIVPLKFISATEMEKILAPFAPEGGILRVDTARNLLMLAGTSRELDSLQETIDIFDVNWLQGMSVGVYRLQNIDAATAAEQLNGVFGKDSEAPVAGLLRFVPITQINALLVITPQVEYLREVQKWIDRLDGTGGERLYVYNVENGDAAYLAEVLGQIFGATTAAPKEPAGAAVAPGLEPATLGAGGYGTGTGGGMGGTTGLSGGTGAGLSEQTPAEGQTAPAGQAPKPAAVSVGGQPGALARPGETVRIVADVENNSLLIWANDRNYEKIIEALRKIDVTPRQVLVEVTLAEVTLSGELRYGLQWFFKNEAGKYQGQGSTLSSGGTGASSFTPFNVPISAIQNSGNGFVYAISDGAGIVRALLDTLATDSRANILSTPQLMVVDNQEASIKVGEQTPVSTGSTITGTGLSTQNIQYRDTGVLLKVRPKVNSGGLVSMDIRQEVVDVRGETTATQAAQQLLTPTFFQRSIDSKVAVQSGETIVLGGLISETREDSKGGIPVLYKVPVIGPLFGSTNENGRRTELLVLITPRVIKDGREARQITDELKDRMRQVAPIAETKSARAVPVAKP